MGNFTNPAQWAAQERLRFIEKSAFWRGTVNRQDLQVVYGVSQAQSSSDLQKYQEMNPGALVYNLKRKRYEGAQTMVCRLHVPCLEEALSLFLGSTGVSFFELGLGHGHGHGQDVGDGSGAGVGAVSDVVNDRGRYRDRDHAHDHARVAGVTLPVRRSSIAVQRACFLAVLHGLRLRVQYLSMKENEKEKGKGNDKDSEVNGWRWLAPHAFAHDGYRWHVRAWCEKHGEYRDFVLGRIKEVEWPVEVFSPPMVDAEWNEWVQLSFIPNPELSADQQESIKADYGMRAGRMTLEVRKAMLDYTLVHLRLPASNGRGQRAFLILDSKF